MHGATDTLLPALVGLVGFIVVFVAGVVVLRWLQKRLGHTATGGCGDIRVLRRQPLGWQCWLLVIEVGGRQYVIATSRNGNVTLIDKLDQALAEPVDPDSFADRLRQAWHRSGNP